MEEMIKWLEAEKTWCSEDRHYWAERAAREMMSMQFDLAATSLAAAKAYLARAGAYGAALDKAREFAAVEEVA